MSRHTSLIDFSCTGEAINRILQRKISIPPANTRKYSCRFNQNEDQFLLLEKPLTVPALPVHHDIDNPNPPDGYMDKIAAVCEYLMDNCPELAAGTRWFFDAAAIHTPSFYRITNIDGQNYLYLLMIDLTCRPLDSTVTEQGTNNRTHAYTTNRIYFECDYFPLASIGSDGNSATLLQTIPVTWKGEAGQGYMIHGIWMDSDINKFFSKLILPAGKRNHPYYPVTCKQHCVTMNAFGQNGPELLHRIREFIEPALNPILQDLQTAPFSELMPLFSKLRSGMPPEFGKRWENLTVQTYLNEREQKEYTVEF